MYLEEIESAFAHFGESLRAASSYAPSALKAAVDLVKTELDHIQGRIATLDALFLEHDKHLATLATATVPSLEDHQSEHTEETHE